jgi:hypothetical protein
LLRDSCGKIIGTAPYIFSNGKIVEQEQPILYYLANPIKFILIDYTYFVLINYNYFELVNYVEPLQNINLISKYKLYSKGLIIYPKNLCIMLYNTPN